MVVKMTVESQAFQGIFGGLAGGGGGGGKSGGGGFGSIFQSLFGGGGSGSSGMGTSANPVIIATPNQVGDSLQTDIGDAYSTFAGGSGGDFTGGAAAAAGVDGGGGFGGILGGIQGLLGGKVGSTTVGGALGFAGLGAGLGGAFGSLMGGGSHDTWGSIVGGIGGAAGSIFGGPIGGMIGSSIGGLIGSLFGNKGVNAHDNPDITNTQQYGQGLANLIGAQAGANGQTFQEDSATSSLTGGLGEGQTIANYIAKTGGAGLSNQEISLFSQFTQGADAITGLKDGVLSFKNGASAYWSDVLQMAQDSMTKLEANGGLTPTYTLSRLYPDLNQAYMLNQQQQVLSAGPNGGVQGGGVGGPRATTGQAPPVIHLTVQGSVIGPGGIDDVASAISTAMARQNAGSLPGGYQRSLSFSRGDAG
jgi:hypothetical protein